MDSSTKSAFFTFESTSSRTSMPNNSSALNGFLGFDPQPKSSVLVILFRFLPLFYSYQCDTCSLDYPDCQPFCHACRHIPLLGSLSKPYRSVRGTVYRIGDFGAIFFWLYELDFLGRTRRYWAAGDSRRGCRKRRQYAVMQAAGGRDERADDQNAALRGASAKAADFTAFLFIG